MYVKRLHPRSICHYRSAIEQLAQDRFGKGVKRLNKLEASGLIDELLVQAGQSQPRNARFSPKAGPDDCAGGEWCGSGGQTRAAAATVRSGLRPGPVLERDAAAGANGLAAPREKCDSQAANSVLRAKNGAETGRVQEVLRGQASALGQLTARGSGFRQGTAGKVKGKQDVRSNFDGWV